MKIKSFIDRYLSRRIDNAIKVHQIEVQRKQAAAQFDFIPKVNTAIQMAFRRHQEAQQGKSQYRNAKEKALS